ncbi:hypothetical protein [Gimesia aquarii]|uniref:Uncharacterized protein n=1 Tax=Gimesia aquarii TaxID=2527964 RepID=A0A517VRT0_9PLAN|nr:hypothetical protein [Gimesia aquarii]QDT95722.1 hypothetical protein V144x_11690 [Gimesia aquarii]
MRRIIASLLFMLIGAGGMYAAFEYHLIQSKEGWLVVPKSQAGLRDAYVDIREWRAANWKEHPRLAQSLIDDGKGNLIIQSASNGLLDGVFQLPNKKRSAEKEESSVKL